VRRDNRDRGVSWVPASEVQAAGEYTAAAVSSPALAVPASLHASLMARLDRLGPAKEVAQIGAAIGREFSHALLAAVARKPEAELASALTVSCPLVCCSDRACRRMRPTYSSMPSFRTRPMGRCCASHDAHFMPSSLEILETHFAEIAENQPELLARHCTEAGMIEKAAILWGKAGQRSLERSALVEAVEQLTRALAQMRGSGAIRANGMRHSSFSLRSMAGSPKGLTRAI
jgi:hypothetical protein